MTKGMEWQVCSLESSKRLKELGVKQESLFLWFVHERVNEPDYKDCLCVSSENNKWNYPEVDWNHYAAFTVAELGEMLPDWFYSQRLDGDRGWVCDGDREMNPNPYIECWTNNTEAEVRAKMLIHLIENNLIKGAGKNE